MPFSATQIRKLQRDIKSTHVRTRDINGRELAYIEGWHAIDEANRIFGFDGWNRETVESRCVQAREVRGAFHVLYLARVKITVRAEGDIVIREGFGTGEAQCETLGEAHDKAVKTAETDATKRALATFGKPFGLSLYLGLRRPPANPDIQRRRTLQKLGANGRYYVPPRTAIDATKLMNQAIHANGSSGRPAPAPLTSPGTTPDESNGADSDDRPAPATNGGLLIERTRRRRDPHHLRFVAAQPCLVCSRTPSDAHHLKFAQPRALGSKVSDEFTVPLCRIHHRQLHHGGNEVAWWMDMDIDPLPIAQELWQRSHTAVSEASAE